MFVKLTEIWMDAPEVQKNDPESAVLVSFKPNTKEVRINFDHVESYFEVDFELSHYFIDVDGVKLPTEIEVNGEMVKVVTRIIPRDKPDGKYWHVLETAEEIDKMVKIVQKPKKRGRPSKSNSTPKVKSNTSKKDLLKKDSSSTPKEDPGKPSKSVTPDEGKSKNVD